ncbi:MAG: tripartite tricarboxylate transporter permease [Candidatus Nanohalobium sp.]
MIDLLSLGLAGVLAGALTGVTPGIHPNTVIFSSIPFYLSSGLELVSYAAFVSGISISHTFHDFIPSIYLQAPEASTALSSMPGAEKAAEGRGPEAFNATLLGGLVSVITVTLALPFLVVFLEDVYSLVQPLMAYLVAFFLFFLVFENFSLEAVVTAAVSGLLGILSLNSSLSGSFILMPVFSGLFAVPAVSSSLKRDFELPEQEEGDFNGFRGSMTGMAAGLIAGTVPGVGAAGATTFLSPVMDDEYDFLAGMGGVNTTDIVVSFLALLTLDKSRSGASVALKSLGNIMPYEMFTLIGLSVFCAGFSALLALRTHKLFLRIVRSINFRLTGFSILLLLLILSYVLSGWFGLVTLITASGIGFYSMINNCRACCMAVLLIPVLVAL